MCRDTSHQLFHCHVLQASSIKQLFYINEQLPPTLSIKMICIISLHCAAMLIWKLSTIYYINKLTNPSGHELTHWPRCNTLYDGHIQ
jgi:hypothetical protein